MPTFYGRSTTIQLSVADLAKAVTENPITRQCPESSRNITNTDLEFTNASRTGTLAEGPLAGDDGMRLRYLGKDGNMPFRMAQAGKNFFDPDLRAKKTQRPARSVEVQVSDRPAVYDSSIEGNEEGATLLRDPCSRAESAQRTALIPHALCLTVFLSRASFFQTTTEKGLKQAIKNDVKVDVYFNGQFVDSRVVTNKQFRASGSRGMQARILRFTGQKLQRMIEKPWVFTPRSRALSIVIGEDAIHIDRAVQAAANQRWSAISSALLAEADRDGRGRNGDRPFIGDYLESLASLPMPSAVLSPRKTCESTFGVIDTVITWGSGHKDGPESKYLTGPTRTKAGRSPSRSRDDTTIYRPSNEEVSNQDTPVPNVSSAMFTGKEPLPHSTPVVFATPTAQARTVPQTRTEALAAALTLDGKGHEPSKIVERARIMKELFPTSGRTLIPTLTPKQLREPSVASEPTRPQKRQRAKLYYDVITTKQTMEEEFESIGVQAIEAAKAAKEARVKRQRAAAVGLPIAKPGDSSPLSSAPSDVSVVDLTNPSKVVVLKISPEKLKTSPFKSGESMRAPPRHVESKMPTPISPSTARTPISRQSTSQRRSSSAREDSTFTASTWTEDSSAVSRSRSQTAQLNRSSEDLSSSSWRRSQTAQLISSTEDVSTSTRHRSGTTQSIPSTDNLTGGSRRRSHTAQLTSSTEHMSISTRRRSGTTQSIPSADNLPNSNRRRSQTAQVNPGAEAYDADFVVPELSQNCCATYAAPGVVRNVGSVRGGVFTAKGVIMGVRFIVG